MNAVDAWLLPALGIGTARNGAGVDVRSWPRESLVSCTSWPTPPSRIGLTGSFRGATWGVRRERVAGALAMGGQEGPRSNEAFVLVREL